MNGEFVRFVLLIAACFTGSMSAFAKEPVLPVKAEKPGNVDRRGEEGFNGLFTIDRDGSKVQFLAAAPGMLSSSSPEWSRDGKKIVFAAIPKIEAFERGHIFVTVIDGPDRGDMKDLGIGCGPTWSPDGRQIAFTMYGDASEAGAGVWVMNADGTGRKRFCEGWYPRWSPDGREICVTSYSEKRETLHFVEVITGRVRKVLGDDIAVVGGVTWSPDGKRVVFVGTMDNRAHVAVIDADGNRDSLAILYSEDDTSRAPLGAPAWSPDGKEIVFAIQDLDAAGGRKRRWLHSYLYTISAEMPSEPKLLEPKKVGLINGGMMWSPDGKKMVFSSER